MIIPVRLFDGTIFDFDDKYIQYNDTVSAEYEGVTVYKSTLSKDFIKDYNIPLDYFERSEYEHELLERIKLVATHSIGLQIGLGLAEVELLSPEEAYELDLKLEYWFMNNFYIDYFNHKFQVEVGNFHKDLNKTWAIYYLMSVYGICPREALLVVRSRDFVKKHLEYGKGKDEEMNKLSFKHFDANVRDIMINKKIQFPQTVVSSFHKLCQCPMI